MNLSQRVVQELAASGSNMTSRQQFSMLDTMLVRALDPLASETDAYLEWVAEILDIAIKSRRKNAPEMLRACARILSGERHGNELLVAAGLDRGHAFSFLNRAIEIHQKMEEAELFVAHQGHANTDDLVVINRSRRLLGNSPRLSPALRASRYWHAMAVRWRNSIINHYLKLLLKGAISMNRASGGRVETDPTFQDAWVTATMSANRFRSDSGAFASFLGRSLKGTYRVAASNSLGLAAPGARVHSDVALQTAPLDKAIEHVDPTGSPTHQDDLVLRSVMALSRHPDVRSALIVSELSPVLAMNVLGIGPARTGVKPVQSNPTGTPPADFSVKKDRKI